MIDMIAMRISIEESNLIKIAVNARSHQRFREHVFPAIPGVRS